MPKDMPENTPSDASESPVRDGLVPKDYRTVKSANLWTRDVLIHFSETGDVLSCGSLCEVFGIKPPDACMRLKRLDKWGCISQINKGQYRNREYTVTKWGFKCAERWGNEQGEAGSEGKDSES